jgi:hypothetical protein
MRNKTLLLLIVASALAVPAAAFAGKPSPKPSHGGKGQPRVLYILKGTLSAYTAASSGGNGSVTIAVTRSNRHGHALESQSLTFAVSTQTRIVLHDAATTVTDGDKGIVKIRAPKSVAAADLPTRLEAATASQVVDQGAPATHS